MGKPTLALTLTLSVTAVGGHGEHQNRSKAEMAQRHWTRMLTEFPPPPDLSKPKEKGPARSAPSVWSRETRTARIDRLRSLQMRLQEASYKEGGQQPEHLFDFYDKVNPMPHLYPHRFITN